MVTIGLNVYTIFGWVAGFQMGIFSQQSKLKLDQGALGMSDPTPVGIHHLREEVN